MMQNKTPRIRKNGTLGWLAFALVIYLFALQSCAGVPESSFAPPTSALLSTSIPAYVATEQASAIQARSTIQAGEAQAYNLALTGTAVAVEINYQTTLVALNLTQSAATEQYFNRQTQASGEATATASQVAAGGTATAVSMASTSTAQSATATQAEADNRVHSTATQLAINEMIRRDESQRQTLLFRTWALRLALVLVFAFGLFLIWKATPWLLLKFFGFQSWNGKPIIVIPDKNGGFKIADIARSLGPGLEFDQNGRLITSGSAPDAQMQNAIAARAQAAELLLSVGNLPAETKKQVLRQAATLSAPTNPGPSLPVEIANVEFKVLPADDHQIGAWLRDVEPKLLDSGE